MDEQTHDSATQRLLGQARAGDRAAFDEIFAHYRPYLVRLLALDLDPKLRRRVDASDLVQEAQLEAFRRLADYLNDPRLPFRLWLRQIARDRLLKARRRHLGAARRTLQREVPLPEESSHLLAQQLLAGGTSPSGQVNQADLARRLRRALAELPEADRDILLLRNYEGLSYEEVSYVLQIEPPAARKRHGRALIRLHKILFEGGLREYQI